MPPGAHQAHAFVPFENTAINQSIAGRFEQQVAQHPDRLAVVSAESQLTYAELNQVANRIARAVLSHLGEGEEPVALLFEEGAFIIAAILGVLKAGKIYVPLDPAFPHARMEYMLENSEARLLLTNGKHLSQAHRVAVGGQQILDCDDVDVNIDAGNLDRTISAEAGAVILYTSGSTGRPKGCSIVIEISLSKPGTTQTTYVSVQRIGCRSVIRAVLSTPFETSMALC
jgi:non-ribosomal peptide synthetase component F